MTEASGRAPTNVAEESLSSDSNDKSSVTGGSSSSASTRSRSRKSANPMPISSAAAVPKNTPVSQELPALVEESRPQRVTRKSLSSQSSASKDTPAPVPVPALAAATTGTLNRKRKLSKPSESIDLQEKKIKAEKLQELETAAVEAPAPPPEATAGNESRGPVKRKASVKANESIVKPPAPPPKSPSKAAAATGDKKKGAKMPESAAVQVKQETMKAPVEIPTPVVPAASKASRKSQPKKVKTETKLNISSCDVDENTRDGFSDTDKAAANKPKAMAAVVKKSKSESVDTADDVSSRDESSSASALQISKKSVNIPDVAKNTNSLLEEEGDSQSQSQEELKNDVGDLSQSAEPKKRKKRRGSTFDLEHSHR